jgi:hypothetical protein
LNHEPFCGEAPVLFAENMPVLLPSGDFSVELKIPPDTPFADVSFLNPNFAVGLTCET